MRLLTGSFLAVCLIAMATAMSVVDTEQAKTAVVQGTSQFSANFFQAIAEKEKGNLITSPLSAALVLAMAGYGAGGETEKQLRQVLHMPSPDSLGLTGYQNVIDSLNNVKDVELSIANKVFVNDKFSVKQSYKSLTESYFRSVTEAVDFGKATEAASTINGWVKQQTRNRINEIVSDRDLTPLTALVLVNAVYFKGQWKNKFDPNLTQDLPFHVDNYTVKNVPTMYRKGNLRYGDLPDLKAKFVEIPYKGDELSMLLIVPDEINGLAEVERKLQSMNLVDIMRQGYEREVKLYLPKFKIESKIGLEDVLQELGLTDMFDQSRANFSRISDEPLYVSKAVQKAFIEVNEEGSEAAGVTALFFTEAYSLVTELDFMVNRPFIYSIVKTERKADGSVNVLPLFIGHIVDLVV